MADSVQFPPNDANLFVHSNEQAALLNQLNGGKKRCVELIIKKYGSMIWNISLSSMKDRAEAEELTLDIFEEIWKRCPDFDSEKTTEFDFIKYILTKKIFCRKHLPAVPS